MLQTAGVDLHLAPNPNTRHKAQETVLVIPDSQNGFREGKPMHDRLAWEAAVWLANEIQPDGIVELGDMMDMPTFSGFRKTPDLLGSTQRMIDETWWWQTRVRAAAPSAWIRWLEGNHEKRYMDTLHDQVPDMAMLRDIQLPKLLRLEDLGVTYQSGYPTHWMYRGVEFQHGEKYSKHGGQTAAKYLVDVPHSVVYGHSHKRELASKTYMGVEKFAGSPGCLCHTDGRVPGTHNPDWQNGLMLVHYDKDNHATAELVAIEGGRIFFRGESMKLKHNDRARIKDIGS